MKVPLLDLKGQYSSIKDEARRAIDDVCDSQNFILGPQVKELEEAVASYSGAGYGIGVSSGTDALLISLMALDVSYGDTVLTTPYTFFATGGVISRLGARPVFIDIDPDDYNIDTVKLRLAMEKAIKKGNKPKAVIPVHLYGQCADMDPMIKVASEYDIKVVEDAAQAIGAEYKGRRAGSMGDIGCFSFFPSKNLGGFGDGGMVVTNDNHLAEKIAILRVHGSSPKYYHKIMGGNFRLDTLQAAVVNVKLKHLENWTLMRQKNAERYNELFKNTGILDPEKISGSSVSKINPVSLPLVKYGNRHIYNQYIIRVWKRDELRKFLSDNEIGTEIYYPLPLHLQECYAYLGHKEGDFPHAEKA
ncbi:MAG: DegT/DnrJ/EryC1/StrS family aminotransferase, partial [Nitrospirota bacterium]